MIRKFLQWLSTTPPADIHAPRRSRAAAFLSEEGGKPQPYGVRIAEGAEAATSLEPARLIDGVLSRFDAERGMRVDGIIPPGFEAYARVLHPASRDVWGRESVRWSEVAAWSGRVMHPEVQWEALIDVVRDPAQPQPWLDKPAMGYLYPQVRAPLIEILLQHTREREHCWAAVWEGWGEISDVYTDVPMVAVPYRNYLLFRAQYDVLNSGIFIGPAGRDVRISPSLWWPDDRAWCVATDIDLQSTFVGGSRECIAQILADARLEAFPAELHHRVDRRGDWVNGSYKDDV